MDTSKYTFRIDYSDGLKITVYDLESKDTQFLVRVLIHKSKINSQLKWNYNGAGGKWIEEEFINSEEFIIGWGENILQSQHYYTYFYKCFAPYYIEIYDLSRDKELVYTEYFDTRNKLVNFTLHSDNPETLHTWMCVIERFKKENNCQISITNDYLKENQKYDFVDCYWKQEENFQRYYAGYEIGRFETDNAPNLYKNPDGTQG